MCLVRNGILYGGGASVRKKLCVGCFVFFMQAQQKKNWVVSLGSDIYHGWIMKKALR